MIGKTSLVALFLLMLTETAFPRDYNILEYNHLIDTRNRVDSVFLEPAAAQ
jgi:hypothetical protein